MLLIIPSGDESPFTLLGSVVWRFFGVLITALAPRLTDLGCQWLLYRWFDEICGSGLALGLLGLWDWSASSSSPSSAKAWSLRGISRCRCFWPSPSSCFASRAMYRLRFCSACWLCCYIGILAERRGFACRNALRRGGFWNGAAVGDRVLTSQDCIHHLLRQPPMRGMVWYWRAGMVDMPMQAPMRRPSGKVVESEVVVKDERVVNNKDRRAAASVILPETSLAVGPHRRERRVAPPRADSITWRVTALASSQDAGRLGRRPACCVFRLLHH